MVIQRQGDNSYRIYFGITAPEHFVGTEIDLKDVQSTRQVLLSTFFHDWADELKDYIRRADNFRSWPLYQLPADELIWSSVPGVTLAGDAAHLSLPNGQGVNLAMTDAFELTSKIAHYGIEKVNQAVAEYERDALIRGVHHIKDGEKMNNIMAHPDGVKGVLKVFSGAE